MAWQAFFVLRLLRLIDVLPVILGRFGSITLLPYAITLAFIGVFGGLLVTFPAVYILFDKLAFAYSLPCRTRPLCAQCWAMAMWI